MLQRYWQLRILFTASAIILKVVTDNGQRASANRESGSRKSSSALVIQIKFEDPFVEIHVGVITIGHMEVSNVASKAIYHTGSAVIYHTIRVFCGEFWFSRSIIFFKRNEREYAREIRKQEKLRTLIWFAVQCVAQFNV